jgi:serine/threonine-protein kinase
MSGIPAGAGSLLGKRLGRYEILALLALGGTAEIYLARIGGTSGFEKYVVVKCLHDHLADDTEFVKMFLDEARLAAVLDHSNIVQTFELGEHEDRYYMVMEFLAGLSLAMIVRRAADRLPGGKIPVPLTMNIAAQAAAGLHYAHERQANGKPLNMVHRDISPQNLVVGFEGVVKVVDFGIARADQRDTKTKAGTIKGKFAYMSPEQCVASNIDRRTDVFALGVIMWELLTGRRLFKRNSPYETYQAVIECNVPVPSSLNVELDPPLDAIVMKAVAKDKENRYPTAEALGDAVLGYLHHRGKGSGPAEMGRWIEASFAQEIEEHTDRMRELIENRAIETGVGWGEDEDEKKNQETVDIGGKGESLDTGDIQEVRPSEASLQGFVNRLKSEAEPGADPDEPPPDRTRIEENPLEKVLAMEAQARAKVPAVPVPPGSVTGGPAPLPAPPTVALGRPSAGQPIQVPQRITPPKYGELANAKTQIHDGNTPPPAAAPKRAPELAETALGQPINAQIAGDLQPRVPEHVRTGPVPAAPPHRATQVEDVVEPPPDARLGNRASGPTQPAPNMAAPSSYPVLSGGRPYNSDLAPADLPQAQRSPYNSASAPSVQAGSPAAAGLMSPVGDQYRPQVDWAAAAAKPAKALPPWMYAVLFVGALGVALLITIVIAKIARH